MQLAIESACANAVLWYEDIAQLIEISSAADSAALWLLDYIEPRKFTIHYPLILALSESGLEKGAISMVHVSIKSVELSIGMRWIILKTLTDNLGTQL